MSKHTAGPWIAREVRGVGLPGQIGWAIDYNDDQEQVVDYVYEEADAHLIAAAPELLEFVMEWLDRQGTDNNYMTSKARAAIAKATGDNP